MVKTVKKLLVIFAVLSIGFVLSSCADNNTAGGDDGPILLGNMFPMTGAQAYFGFDMLNAMTLAVEQINEAGGVLGREFVLLPVADDGCDPMMAAQAATLISSSDAHFVVGSYCSAAVIAALQEFYDNDLIMVISSANSTRITEMGLSTAFMLNSPGTHQIDTLVDVINHVGVTNVAVIHQGDDFTQNLSDIANNRLPAAGLNIVTTQVMELGVPDASAIVTAVRNAGAEVVFWAGYFADGGNMIRQLRQGGFDGYIIVADGATSIELINATGPAGEGVLALSPPTAEFTPGGAEFAAAFEERFGDPPGAFAPLAYDTPFVLAAAIEAAGTIEFEAVRDALQNIDFEAMTGRIVFTSDRERHYSNFLVLEIRGGEFHLVDF